MPSERRPRTTARATSRSAAPPPEVPEPPEGSEDGTTGRLLVLLAEGAERSAATRGLARAAGVKVASSADLGVDAPAELEAGAGLYLDTLGVVVIEPAPGELAAVAAASGAADGVVAVEPERIVYAIDEPLGRLRARVPGRCRRPGRAGALAQGGGGGGEPAVTETFLDTDTTWGLKATGVVGTTFTGKGVRVAVLDTGFDSGHPDFVGRHGDPGVVHHRSDRRRRARPRHPLHRHGLRAATAPDRSRAYGVASEAEIFAGKVLSNQGRGADGGILAGIDWAIRNACTVISMSLGAPVAVGGGFSTVYETVAQRALAAGCADRGRGGQRELPSRSHLSCRPPGQLSVDHRRGRPRLEPGHRPLLVRRDEPAGRPGRHRRARRRRPLVGAPAPPLRHHERHQHGDPARRRPRRPARRGQSRHDRGRPWVGSCSRAPAA